METMSISKVSPGRTVAVSNLILLTIVAVLSIFAHLTLNNIVTKQKTYSSIINISGLQRMLSQQSALFTSRYYKNRSEIERQTAEASIKHLLSNHKFLMSIHEKSLAKEAESLFSNEIMKLYYEKPTELIQSQANYVQQLTKILDNIDSTENEDMEALIFDSQSMMEKFDLIVDRYETESKLSVDRALFLQKFILVLIIGLVLFQAAFVIRPLLKHVEKQAIKLEDAATKDYLTGLLNRRTFDVLASQAISLSKRYNSPLSMAMLDIDTFKAINDKHGHAYGDQVIRLVSKEMTSITRESDSVFRFGGEEFAILMPKTDEQQAYVLIDKIRVQINLKSKNSADWNDEITISGGISEWYETEDTLENSIDRADSALYCAKENGKNKVVINDNPGLFNKVSFT